MSTAAGNAMGKLEFGRLSDAWKGEATDFTPLLAAQLDLLGGAIGLDLASIGESEIQTTGGRRIDIVATEAEGAEFVIENQYGRADHDHLTRGLAYAVARRARGLIVVAEEHRDEFRAVAQYLNDLAELDIERGISVWLVEAKAVRIDTSLWAPLFRAVVEPNRFTANVEQTKQSETKLPTIDEFWSQFDSPATLEAAETVVSAWIHLSGARRRLGPNHVVLEAQGPSANGFRTVVAVYSDGRVLVPFGSYAGQNSGIPIPTLVTDEFRARANELFGFGGSEVQAKTKPGWLVPDRVDSFLEFCLHVASAYRDGVDSATTDSEAAPPHESDAAQL